MKPCSCRCVLPFQIPSHKKKPKDDIQHVLGYAKRALGSCPELQFANAFLSKYIFTVIFHDLHKNDYSETVRVEQMVMLTTKPFCSVSKTCFVLK